MSAKECQTCGREDGHWLGCRGERPELLPPAVIEVITAEADELAKVDVSTLPEVCEYGECMNTKRPQGKGPKPKYCDDHREQKNRK